MASMRVKIDNAQQLYNAFRRASDNLADSLQEDFSASIEDGVNEAKANARYRTGFMRNHIHSAHPQKWGYQIVSEATYSSYQDLGTERIEGTHFMEKGRDLARTEMVQNIHDNFKKYLDVNV